MKRGFLIYIGATAALFILLAACNQKPEEEAKPEMTQEQLIARGDYLVSTIGCDDCHTPKVMSPKGPEFDMSRRFMGYPADQELPPIDESVLPNWALFNHELTAAVGPWGVSFSANITSDETGIGTWSYEQFERAMRQGLYKGMEGSRPLLPPMPWQNFAKLSDEDLRAMFAFLKSTTPIRNVVPANIPPAAPSN